MILQAPQFRDRLWLAGDRLWLARWVLQNGLWQGRLWLARRVSNRILPNRLATLCCLDGCSQDTCKYKCREPIVQQTSHLVWGDSYLQILLQHALHFANLGH